MKASSAMDIRERTKKVVTLPSGLLIEIRALSFADCIELKKIDPQGPADLAHLTEEEVDLLRLYSVRAIIMAAVSPLFTDRDEERTRDDRVYVGDLSHEDFAWLTIEILEFSCRTKEPRTARTLH